MIYIAILEDECKPGVIKEKEDIKKEAFKGIPEWIFALPAYLDIDIKRKRGEIKSVKQWICDNDEYKELYKIVKMGFERNYGYPIQKIPIHLNTDECVEEEFWIEVAKGRSLKSMTLLEKELAKLISSD